MPFVRLESSIPSRPHVSMLHWFNSPFHAGLAITASWYRCYYGEPRRSHVGVPASGLDDAHGRTQTWRWRRGRVSVGPVLRYLSTYSCPGSACMHLLSLSV